MDLVGACATSAATGLLFATKVFNCGLPTWILISMAMLAFGFACLDAVGVFLATDPRPFLLMIAFLNLVYCVLSVVICIVYFEQLTWFGAIYFFIEVALVTPLAIWEWFVFSITGETHRRDATLK
jgi:hypothetical protein